MNHTATDDGGPPASVSIHRARLEEAVAVRECLAAAFEPYRDRYTRQAFHDTVPTIGGVEQRIRDRIVFVAVDREGTVAGTVACHVMPDAPGEPDAPRATTGHLRGMGVLPVWCGTGTAVQLLEAAEAELRRRGCERVTLNTTQPLGRAVSFYVRQGFTPTGRVSDFFGMPLFEYAKAL